MVPCRKRRYATPVDAMLALERIQGQRCIEDVEKHERTFYWCDYHGAYHLTSWKTEIG